MLANQRLFYMAFIPFIAAMILNFPFPHRHPFGEEIVSILNIPVATVNGLQSVGLTSLLLLIISLFMFYNSLKKYQSRFVLMAIIAGIFLPNALADTYQKTLADGIYAISYDQEASECSFEMITADTMQAVCELPFENLNGKDVSFHIDFYDQYPFEEEARMVSLLNQIEPYKATIKADNYKLVTIKANIDVSEVDNHVTSGTAGHVNIIIKQGDQLRKL
ncbi:hypothetical protein GWK91_13000 [Virgibacillus sp. MSP4-1]|uniref:hypothetical protein n=1 Tax=Virgibacillus sp. MSP4-1 TaxID=2700081 RepID=UPI0003A48095|nr:hypothetical protein [Virgibacillus sp. MSP4-1]QHS23807.1 hypothetical protein GWK91_13000 [Virgibacillus sp. MSP4-1]